MAKIIFEEPDGNEHAVDIVDGLSIMEGAVKDSVAGIDADCGGACSCATCASWTLGAPSTSPGC